MKRKIILITFLILSIQVDCKNPYFKAMVGYNINNNLPISKFSIITEKNRLNFSLISPKYNKGGLKLTVSDSEHMFCIKNFECKLLSKLRLNYTVNSENFFVSNGLQLLLYDANLSNNLTFYICNKKLLTNNFNYLLTNNFCLILNSELSKNKKGDLSINNRLKTKYRINNAAIKFRLNNTKSLKSCSFGMKVNTSNLALITFGKYNSYRKIYFVEIKDKFKNKSAIIQKGTAAFKFLPKNNRASLYSIINFKFVATGFKIDYQNEKFSMSTNLALNIQISQNSSVKFSLHNSYVNKNVTKYSKTFLNLELIKKI